MNLDSQFWNSWCDSCRPTLCLCLSKWLLGSNNRPLVYGRNRKKSHVVIIGKWCHFQKCFILLCSVFFLPSEFFNIWKIIKLCNRSSFLYFCRKQHWLRIVRGGVAFLNMLKQQTWLILMKLHSIFCVWAVSESLCLIWFIKINLILM